MSIKQTFEVEFIDSVTPFPEQLISECIISGKHLIGRIRVTEVTEVDATDDLPTGQLNLTDAGLIYLGLKPPSK